GFAGPARRHHRSHEMKPAATTATIAISAVVTASGPMRCGTRAADFVRRTRSGGVRLVVVTDFLVVPLLVEAVPLGVVVGSALDLVLRHRDVDRLFLLVHAPHHTGGKHALLSEAPKASVD